MSKAAVLEPPVIAMPDVADLTPRQVVVRESKVNVSNQILKVWIERYTEGVTRAEIDIVRADGDIVITLPTSFLAARAEFVIEDIEQNGMPTRWRHVPVLN